MSFLKVLLFLFSVLALSGCTQMLPARATEISQGVYELKAYGNIFASRETLQEKIDKKSAKVCEGKGYEYMELGKFEVKTEKNYSSPSISENHYVTLERKIQCNK